MALAIDASLLSESLYEFVKAAWHIVEPGTEYRDNWHIHAICDHLEAVSRGDIRNLIVNIPPRHMKSLIISVMWPAWEWTWCPTRRWLFASYGDDLATRDAVKTRRLIQSAWYQSRWADPAIWREAFYLTSDQNQKTRYENNRLGYRISTSVGGLGTGEGGDRIVVDDPHNVQKAESEAVRTTTLRWWDETMSTRGNDPQTVAKVIIMQRVHEADLTAHCLKKGGYEHLCLPAEFEPDHPTLSSTSLGFKDPRKKPGQLLWENRFPRAELDALKVSLGEYGTAGQLQQRPTPRGGGEFKRKFMQYWPATRELPAFQYIIQSYDTAYTEKTANDPTAHTTWGVFTDRLGRAAVMLLDAWDEYLNYAALRKKVIADWRAKYGGVEGNPQKPGRRADALLVEVKGSGISLIQELQTAAVPAQSYNPGKADKVARAQRIMPLYEMGLVWVPESSTWKEGAMEATRPATWARAFVDQLHKFSAETSEHDDYVDTFTQVLIFLKDAGWLEAPQVEDDDPEARAYTGRPRNPYD